eukprot:CAMPEP_0172169288 /NCGR_PEP_ID=MMETSP1050-20130122/10622_1 /TAXON_ID=233186 /ORGANISM="Cryptomonas curvata, Strain CCAP979/52" /LENGTH=134 /DNA_ID=CAMNT_0012840329 /DNA_START=741 /DNA_END=1145 /DNA_ORIENTATION=+
MTVRVWSICGAEGVYDGSAITWECIASLVGHMQFVYAVCFHSNGCILASGSEDGTARIWALDDAAASGDANSDDSDSDEGGGGKCLAVLQAGGGGCVHSVDWSQDGRHLATAGADGRVRIWETGGDWDHWVMEC